jgi:hypothetical protein
MISSDILITHLQHENVMREMADGDPEDSWLAIGAGASVAVFGVCVLVAVLRRHFCQPPHVALKASRSDTDLENMLTDPPSRILPPNFVE